MHGLREARSRCNSCSYLNSMWDAIASSILGNNNGEGNREVGAIGLGCAFFLCSRGFRMMTAYSEMGRMTWEKWEKQQSNLDMLQYVARLIYASVLHLLNTIMFIVRYHPQSLAHLLALGSYLRDLFFSSKRTYRWTPRVF